MANVNPEIVATIANVIKSPADAIYCHQMSRQDFEKSSSHRQLSA